MDLVKDLLAGDQLALAKLITSVENRETGYKEALDLVYPHTGRSWRIGITGPPGVGKSTLVDKLTPLFRAEGKTVGILACDPSSPFSHGAFLGDRIRMRDIDVDEGVFIRSTATRGSLGGLAKATQEAALLLEAYGFDIILFETIGVGQAEVDITQSADSTVVMLTPQSGDAVQAMKAGLMEIADLFVINKSDLGGADSARESLQSILTLSKREWSPPVVKTVADEGEGVEELKRELETHYDYLKEGDRWRSLRKERLKSFLKRIIEDELQLRLWAEAGIQALDGKVEELLERRSSPYQAAAEILKGMDLD